MSPPPPQPLMVLDEPGGAGFGGFSLGIVLFRDGTIVATVLGEPCCLDSRCPMKSLVPTFALALILLVPGCYTQFGTVGEKDYFAEFPDDDAITSEEVTAQEDTAQFYDDEEYDIARNRFYFDYYYPAVSFGIGFGYPGYWYDPFWSPWYGYYPSLYYGGYASYWYPGGGWYPSWQCCYYPVDPYPPYPVAPVAYSRSRTTGTTRGGGSGGGTVTRGGRTASGSMIAGTATGDRVAGSSRQVSSRSDDAERGLQKQNATADRDRTAASTRSSGRTVRTAPPPRVTAPPPVRSGSSPRATSGSSSRSYRPSSSSPSRSGSGSVRSTPSSSSRPSASPSRSSSSSGRSAAPSGGRSSGGSSRSAGRR